MEEPLKRNCHPAAFSAGVILETDLTAPVVAVVGCVKAEVGRAFVSQSAEAIDAKVKAIGFRLSGWEVCLKIIIFQDSFSL